ncbi:Piso0_000564 [Millerozyma farinosa CBS 7064]|uniref:Piso0_000564 protein n=1 Tax=Pichia sorbitophila (strain ATCC MYA-4447 / BCRC 22081 / CBS 7064 / NBRC 10061 / NRRL Y-12695) TaxID=559304 RepID=G8YVS4_PICSO|nr:Piso0_000564 [Millerozyma farinosa CBS 7064]CCE73518.1 Piso0_000564 [Millerozyma farinosa CBS 7064]
MHCLACEWKDFVVRNQLPLYRIARYYATAGDRIDYHAKFDLHPWPESKNPTPFEIFNIAPNEQRLSNSEFNKILRKKYSSFVKIYHPDIARNLSVYDKKDRKLTPEAMRHRFDQMMKAYDVLKDPRRRLAYGKYENTSWDSYSNSADVFEKYRMANAHRKKYTFENDEEFWRASSWEDYYQMKFNRRPPTREELEKNKYKILGYVLFVGTVAFGLQMMMILYRSDEFERELSLRSLKSLEDLNSSYNNYGEGSTRFQRIKRFLLYRRASLRDRNDIDREAIRNEESQVLQKYAQQQVEKF